MSTVLFSTAVRVSLINQTLSLACSANANCERNLNTKENKKMLARAFRAFALQCMSYEFAKTIGFSRKASLLFSTPVFLAPDALHCSLDFIDPLIDHGYKFEMISRLQQMALLCSGIALCQLKHITFEPKHLLFFAPSAVYFSFLGMADREERREWGYMRQSYSDVECAAKRSYAALTKLDEQDSSHEVNSAKEGLSKALKTLEENLTQKIDAFKAAVDSALAAIQARGTSKEEGEDVAPPENVPLELRTEVETLKQELKKILESQKKIIRWQKEQTPLLSEIKTAREGHQKVMEGAMPDIAQMMQDPRAMQEVQEMLQNPQALQMMQAMMGGSR